MSQHLLLYLYSAKDASFFSKKIKFFSLMTKIMFFCAKTGGKRHFCPFPPEVFRRKNTLISGGGSY